MHGRFSLLLALVMIGSLIVCGSMAAGVTQSTSMITLNHLPPQQLMMILGLCSEEDLLSGKDISWNRSDKPAPAKKTADDSAGVSPMLPKGIHSINTVISKKSVLVIGDAPSVEQFKTIVEMLDVPQKQIQVRVEVYEIPAGAIKMLSAMGKPKDKEAAPKALAVAHCNPSVLKGLREQLETEGAKSVSSPILSTLNDMLAYTKISTFIPVHIEGQDKSAAKAIEVSTEIRVRSKITSDGTIDVSFKAVVPSAAKSDVENAQQANSPWTAEFTAKSGESTVLYEIAKESEDWLLFIVTPTIVEDAFGGKVGVGLIN